MELWESFNFLLRQVKHIWAVRPVTSFRCQTGPKRSGHRCLYSLLCCPSLSQDQISFVWPSWCSGHSSYSARTAGLTRVPNSFVLWHGSDTSRWHAWYVPIIYIDALLICYLGRQIAWVHVVFQLPHKAIPNIFPMLDTMQDATPNHPVYVEWFLPIPSTPKPNHQMYKVSRLICNGRWCASIIPVDLIISSIHLFPRFGHHTLEWNT